MTRIKVRGQWKYLYRAADKEGDTVDFLLRARRDKASARRYFEKSVDQNGEPETVIIDQSGANLAALDALNAERESQSKIAGRSSGAHGLCWASKIFVVPASC
jgi:putative transposase